MMLPHTISCQTGASWRLRSQPSLLVACMLMVCMPMSVALHSQGQNKPALAPADSAPAATMAPRFRQEIMITSENDNYTLQLTDGYYTNGIFAQLSYVGRQQPKGFIKKVQSFEIGQQLFNPARFDSIKIETQDRPFAGYLYAKFQQQLFVKRHAALLGWSVRAGAIGRPSMAEEVQRMYHHLIGIYDVQGWQNQVADEWSLQLSAHYTRSLLNRPPEKRRWDIAATGMANLGNVFTDISGGLLLRAGWMESYQNSAHWGARVSREGGAAPVLKRELYFFVQPLITWQAYNATLQGGLFTRHKSPKTVAIEPWVLATQLGFKWAQNRWTLGMHYTHRSRQAKAQLRPENFLSVQLAYRTGKY